VVNLDLIMVGKRVILLIIQQALGMISKSPWVVPLFLDHGFLNRVLPNITLLGSIMVGILLLMRIGRGLLGTISSLGRLVLVVLKEVLLVG